MLLNLTGKIWKIKIATESNHENQLWLSQNTLETSKIWEFSNLSFLIWIEAPSPTEVDGLST